MKDTIEVIGKVTLLSAAGAIAIKWIGPTLAVPATSPVALVLVLLPAGVMGLILGWRSLRNKV